MGVKGQIRTVQPTGVQATAHAANTSTSAQVLTTATACQFLHSEESRQEKLTKEAAAVSNFCPSCCSEKHIEGS